MAQTTFVGKVLSFLPNRIQRELQNRLQGVPPLTLVLLYTGSALKSRGWFKSRKSGMPVDRDGKPIPWMTYPLISFLNNRLDDSHRVFEYGSGNSTKWLAERVNEVICVEHSVLWANTIRDKLPTNVDLVHQNEKEPYVDEVSKHGEFDVIIVDGEWRNECLASAVENLSESGVIILDNSDRDKYRPMMKNLEQQGYNSIKFRGMAPIIRTESETMVFYPSDNCIEI